jgi:FkbM family methyltransferase
MSAMSRGAEPSGHTPSPRSLLQQALLLHRTFRNWSVVGIVTLLALPGRFPPRRGWQRAGRIRLRMRTREGPILETEARNSWPVIEVFQGDYESPIAWDQLRVVLDVGAHVGAFTCWVAARAPSSRIVALEPEPRNFADLQANVLRNHLTGRVVLVNAAAASDDRMVELRVRGDDRQLSSFMASSGEAIPVQAVALDQFVRSDLDGPIDLVKMDVEGAEWEILPSIRDDTWARISRLVLEVHIFGSHTVQEMEGLLESNHYETRMTSRGTGGEFRETFTLWAEHVA